MSKTAFLILMSLASPASAQEFLGISVSGTGCSAGTNGLWTDLVTFLDYELRSGPGVSLHESRASCEITGRVRLPAGMQYSIPSLTVAGYANISAGEVGHHLVRVEFPSLSRRASKELYFRGPMMEYYAREVLAAGLLWSPCGTGGDSPFVVRIVSTLQGLRRQPAFLQLSEVALSRELRTRPCPPPIFYP